MRLPADDVPVIYLCSQPVDFPKDINGLSLLVDDILCMDPLSGHLLGEDRILSLAEGSGRGHFRLAAPLETRRENRDQRTSIQLAFRCC